MRFRAEQHLRRPTAIRAVREQGRRVECRAFTLWWKPQENPGGISRVCVIASRAAVGGAVQRNRAKRRLRELFRQQQERVPPHCDLLLIARAAATNRPQAELEQRFSEACASINPAAPGPRKDA
jgi:ribonuclease P protein component